MASPMMASCQDRHRAKLEMYCQRLADGPRLLKHVLVSSASAFPDDNQFKSRKSKPPRKCLTESMSPGRELDSPETAMMPHKKGESDTQRLSLEEVFMERLVTIEDAPEEVKFPVLRASHPGGRVFRTQQLGVIKKNNTDQRHPFNLINPNAPAPEYSCYYDKHLKNFFEKSWIRKTLVDQGIITDEHYIREPYKAFKEYIRRKKLPHGTNPIQISPRELQLEKKKLRERDIFADEDIKKYVETEFHVDPALVDEMYSGRRRGSVIPFSDSGDTPAPIEQRKTPEPLPRIRYDTPAELTLQEKKLQEAVHHERINVVVAKRQMLAYYKKTNAMSQVLTKQKRLKDNKKQMALERWEASLNKMTTTFDRKKNSIFNRIKAIEEDKLRRKEEKDREVNKLKKKFSAIFIKQEIAERTIKKRRQKIENAARARNHAWLQKQRAEREEELRLLSKKMRDKQVSEIAEITSNKKSRIDQLQLKCEYYKGNLKEIKDENVFLGDKLTNLQKLQKKMNKNL